MTAMEHNEHNGPMWARRRANGPRLSPGSPPIEAVTLCRAQLIW